MTYHDDPFPTDVSYGSRFGIGHRTKTTRLPSGAAQKRGRWTEPLRRFDVSYGIKSIEQFAAVRDHLLAREGGLHEFPFKDWSDYSTGTNGTGTSTKDDEQIGVGDGTVGQTFQLTKTYSSGSQIRTRNVRKPVNGTVLVAYDGTIKTETTDYTVDYQTGILTSVTDPGVGVVITWGGEFWTPAEYGEEVDDLLEVSFDDFDAHSIPSIVIWETRDETPVIEEYPYGGFINYGDIDGTTVVMDTTKRFHVVESSDVVGVSTLVLPQIASYPDGGFHFVVLNNSGNATFLNVRENAAVPGNLIANLADQETAFIGSFDDPSGTHDWWAFK